ncbi:MAG TPA: 3-methyladenine DNA glycosylase [Bacteroidetes bacterium]|nr:3-methyladenine DNA glycosylase [Bacteroidota bacterium]
MKIDQTKKIPIEFYKQKTEDIARLLIGKLFVRVIDGEWLACEIHETEAYLPDGDYASHAAKMKTLRNAPMFESGGILYVYFIYGVHYCVNIVTENAGIGSAVLLRAGKPLAGIEKMQEFRKSNKIEQLCKGPGNFAKAFDLNKTHNFHRLDSDDIFLCDYETYPDSEIVRTTRIGINLSKDLPLRFYLKDSPYISKK